MTFKLFTILTMSLFYISMGLKHIFDPNYFYPMMPSFLPYKKSLIYISGCIEIILGVLLLIEDYRLYASMGLIVLLVLVFPSNIYIVINEESRKKLKITLLFSIVRLFAQIPLIYLAYWHSF